MEKKPLTLDGLCITRTKPQSLTDKGWMCFYDDQFHSFKSKSLHHLLLNKTFIIFLSRRLANQESQVLDNETIYKTDRRTLILFITTGLCQPSETPATNKTAFLMFSLPKTEKNSSATITKVTRVIFFFFSFPFFCPYNGSQLAILEKLKSKVLYHDSRKSDVNNIVRISLATITNKMYAVSMI